VKKPRPQSVAKTERKILGRKFRLRVRKELRSNKPKFVKPWSLDWVTRLGQPVYRQ